MGFFNRKTSETTSSDDAVGVNWVSVNGKTICVRGSNVSVVNGQIFVDGKLVTEEDAQVEPGFFSSVEKIVIEGDAVSVTCSGDVDVRGSVSGNIDAGMSVNVSGNVDGDIDAGMNVNVGGNVDGNIDVGMTVSISGNTAG